MSTSQSLTPDAATARAGRYLGLLPWALLGLAAIVVIAAVLVAIGLL